MEEELYMARFLSLLFMRRTEKEEEKAFDAGNSEISLGSA